LTLGRKKYADAQSNIERILHGIEPIRAELEAAVESDAQAYENVMDAFRMPKETDEQISSRAGAIERATRTATEVPLRVARSSKRVIELALETAQIGNRNAITDAGAGGMIAAAAVRAAGMNVHINLQSLKDEVASERMRNDINMLEAEVEDLIGQLQRVMEERGGLS
jgi:formiminotetrahydrofolate cyclodeaminase